MSEKTTNPTPTKRKYTKREKIIDTTPSGKIKSTEFKSHRKVIETILETKKLSEEEVSSVKYFVNYMIGKYNEETKEDLI